jgi:hypothetical protein
LTNDEEKKQRVTQLKATSLEDVHIAVAAAAKHYANRSGSSRVRTCIKEFSAHVCHYSNVLDVFVQHHPEYVALGWGAIKLAFGVSEVILRAHPTPQLTVFLGGC